MSHTVWSLGWRWEDPFLAQPLARIREAGADMLPRKARVVLQYVPFTPALSEEIHDELHRKTGAANDWFPRQHSGIDNDVLLPGNGHKDSTFRRYR